MIIDKALLDKVTEQAKAISQDLRNERAELEAIRVLMRSAIDS